MRADAVDVPEDDEPTSAFRKFGAAKSISSSIDELDDLPGVAKIREALGKQHAFDKGQVNPCGVLLSLRDEKWRRIS